MSVTHEVDRPALLTVDEAAKELRIGRSKAYQMIGSGEIPSVRIGESIRVPRRALEAWIDARTATPRTAA